MKPKLSPHGRAAVTYAKHFGWHVFPIREMTKDEPHIAWGKGASNDPKVVEQWWLRWPNANIGLACQPSGVAVIDLDNKPDANGNQTMLDLEFENEMLPFTRKHRTPTGGYHLLFKGAIRNTTGLLGPGVDTRGTGGNYGGYIVLPPSTRKEGKYSAENKVLTLAELPQWVIDQVESRTFDHDGPVDQCAVVELDQQQNIDQAVEYLKTTAPICIANGTGNTTLFSVAATLKDMGISEYTAVELLGGDYNDKCEPPWRIGDGDAKDRLDVIVGNAYAYGKLKAPGEASAEYEFREPEEKTGEDELAAIEARAERERQQAPLNKDDFLFWMTGKSRGFICVPLATDGLDDRKLWVADSVDMKVPKVTYIDGKLKEQFKTDEAAKDAGHKFGLLKTEVIKQKNDKGKIVKEEVVLERLASHHIKYNKRQQVSQVTWWPGKPSVICDTVLEKDGVRSKRGTHAWNYYLPPVLDLSRKASSPDKWIDHVKMLYPDNWKHIVMCSAWRVQRPDVKIHHAVLCGGASRIGKDTIFKPVRYAIGASNFSTVEAHDIMDSPQNNKYLAAVFCLITEVEDFGDENRYTFYKRTKPWLGGTATGTLPIADKYLRRHEVIDVVFIVATTNEMFRGLYIPGDDTRWYVAWSPFDWRAEYLTEGDYFDQYIKPLYRWMYEEGGNQAVAHYLKTLPLDGSALDYPFDPKEPPPRTSAWHEIVRAHQDDNEADSLALALADLSDPAAVTVSEINATCARLGIDEVGSSEGTRVEVPAAFAAQGYRREESAKGKDWAVKIAGKTVKLTVYVQRKLSIKEAKLAAQEAIAREKKRRMWVVP